MARTVYLFQTYRRSWIFSLFRSIAAWHELGNFGFQMLTHKGKIIKTCSINIESANKVDYFRNILLVRIFMFVYLYREKHNRRVFLVKTTRTYQAFVYSVWANFFSNFNYYSFDTKLQTNPILRGNTEHKWNQMEGIRYQVEYMLEMVWVQYGFGKFHGLLTSDSPDGVFFWIIFQCKWIRIQWQNQLRQNKFNKVIWNQCRLCTFES